jgi:hypothetical protein
MVYERDDGGALPRGVRACVGALIEVGRLPTPKAPKTPKAPPKAKASKAEPLPIGQTVDIRDLNDASVAQAFNAREPTFVPAFSSACSTLEFCEMSRTLSLCATFSDLSL